MQIKYVARLLHVQAKSQFRGSRIYFSSIAGLFLFLMADPSAWSQSAVSGQSTSPLAILKQAPKIRFDEPEPTPRPVDPLPYIPPRGPAPPIQRVEPAFTPYAGATVGGAPAVPPQSNPYYQPTPPPLAPRFAAPTPTPRPILGPEDVEPKQKKGFVRGLINAIPFVGDDDEEEEQPTPTPPVQAAEEQGFRGNPDSDTTIYRGYDAAPARDESDGPLLLPPGATPLPGAFSPEPEPSSPPIMTPTPRVAQPSDSVTNLDDPVAETIPPGVGAVREPQYDADAPILTVKRESDSTTQTTAPTDTGSEKAPAVSRSLDEVAPKPLERATTSVVIQESRPSNDSLGPEPDSSATPLKSFDPTATPAPEPSGSLGAVDDMVTTLVVEQADLGMPNPTYEQNTAVLAEFQDAVRKARAEDYAGASQAFREYGLNHPSSGLAPRAYYLSVIFEKSRKQAKENLESLRHLFPESRYLEEVEKRRADLAAPAAPDAVTAAASTELPREKVVRLEKELTVAVGDLNREPGLRKDLGLAYLELEEYDRAYEVLRPAAEQAAGTPAEGEILLALGRVLVARGETVQAISLYETVEQKYPALIFKDAPSAWSVGLAFEGAGRYGKARAIYNTLRQQWPETAEAGWATTRLTDLASLQ